ncbi:MULTISPECIES: galactofuranose ABC transporter, permease protein YjfF [Rhizobium/Agrobacterium group]|jgi:ribose/xylose/arabinose/galactoside ABC-type transport system permease subunit|uniref:Inner membrane ABC transporter permease protein YjfF n=3 Tax=Rhizobium/Agrobacterium group TaxID=227290 RepID=A0A546XBP6_RHIRH|nr:MULTISPECIES: galactofuranose ABC transporter, permease protein YjfF [Rhizobium/Agrobacterium group]AQS63737.1 sugar ABC transporter permease YjfF [Rhizobium rhizogenes]MBB4404335.1 simple sugar transport system permease protein [Agrobacterium radiobacter]MBB5590488.1 simple sugar transport system permease protein [Agrobacterium radiobacter]MCZ7440962.1 sugar ABC transporter permease YjfF [Rhizobium rhizogenes]MCZ7467477.1 sugar ABC transporter permease YjfF [Rhizobium rhizogenes]
MIHSRNLPFLTTLTIFVIAYLLCVLQYPAILSTRVIGNLLTDNAFLGIAAVGMTFVILSGGIDLSIGSVIAFTSVFVAVMVGTYNIHPLLAFAIVLVVSTLFGCLMGAMIRFLSIPPFVVTLAGMFLARGAAYLISTQSVPISHPFIDAIQGFYYRFPGGGRLTALAMLMLLVFAAGMLIASRTRFGANIYALGGNPQSAELMGVPIGATTIGIYALSGFLSGLAGIVYTLYTSSGYSLATVGVELDAIAAVVIGGTLLTGGTGLVAGTFIGLLIQGLIQTYIVFDGTLSSWWTKIVIGVLLFVFIVLQRAIIWYSNRRLAGPHPA